MNLKQVVNNILKLNTMKYSIEKDLPVVPYIIADRAAWNAMEEDKDFDHVEPEVMNILANAINQALVEKADTIYNKSDHFRRLMRDKRRDCRYTLESFMTHWAMGLIRKEKTEKLISYVLKNSKPCNEK